MGGGGGPESDDLSETGRDPGADPGRAQRTVWLARTGVGSHQSDERATEPEHEKDQQVLEARGGPVACYRGGPEAADESGRDRDRQIRLDAYQGGDRAHSQNVAKERPAEADVSEGKADDAAPGAKIRHQGGASGDGVGEHRDGATGDAETREGSPAEDEARRQGNQRRSADRCDHGWDRHVARAAE